MVVYPRRGYTPMWGVHLHIVVGNLCFQFNIENRIAHLFPHPFFHFICHVLFYLLFHLFIHLLIHSFAHLFFHLFFIRLFIRSFVVFFIRLLFIRLYFGITRSPLCQDLGQRFGFGAKFQRFWPKPPYVCCFRFAAFV